MKNAYENGRKIRVIGDGHSWSPIAQTEDILISLHKYSSTEKDIEIDEDKSEVAVKAGTPLRTISTLLESRGYAMEQLGSVASQSIAGAMSTGRYVIMVYVKYGHDQLPIHVYCIQTLLGISQ